VRRSTNELSVIMGQQFAKQQEKFLRENIGGVERGLVDSLPDPVASAWMKFRGYHLETEFLTKWQATVTLYRKDREIAEGFIDMAEIGPDDMVIE